MVRLMKLPVTGEMPCTLTTQSECRLAMSILNELPTENDPYGPRGLFLSASPVDRTIAEELWMFGDLTAVNLYAAVTHPSIQDSRGRRSDTLDAFPPFAFNQSNFASFMEATYLVANQPPSEDYTLHTREAVENARLVGMLLLRSGANDRYRVSHTRLFHQRSANPNHGYNESAALAAQRLMLATQDEFVRAAPDSLQTPEGAVSPIVTAMQNYRATNPLLEQFATATY